MNDKPEISGVDAATIRVCMWLYPSLIVFVVIVVVYAVLANPG